MPDPFYPSVDLHFIIDQTVASGKLAHEGVFRVGSTTTFIIGGTQAIHKRTILVRELSPGEICLEQASALAIRFNFLSPLLNWLEVNKHWKDGAYIVPQVVPQAT